jgi:hypothetical protein
MSLLTLGSIAVGRDLANTGQPVAKNPTVSKAQILAPDAQAGRPTSGALLAEQPAAGSALTPTPPGSVATFGQLLVAQIPSEALLAYTTLLAVFTAGGSYTEGRWILYAAAIVVCAVTVLGNYFAQRAYGFDDSHTAPTQVAALRKLHLPYLPVLAAVLSMAVYGLTVPGSPLQFEVSPTAFAISSGCLAVGGGVMMSIIAPFLGKGNGAKADVTEAEN